MNHISEPSVDWPNCSCNGTHPYKSQPLVFKSYEITWKHVMSPSTYVLMRKFTKIKTYSWNTNNECSPTHNNIGHYTVNRRLIQIKTIAHGFTPDSIFFFFFNFSPRIFPSTALPSQHFSNISNPNHFHFWLCKVNLNLLWTKKSQAEALNAPTLTGQV